MADATGGRQEIPGQEIPGQTTVDEVLEGEVITDESPGGEPGGDAHDPHLRPRARRLHAGDPERVLHHLRLLQPGRAEVRRPTERLRRSPVRCRRRHGAAHLRGHDSKTPQLACFLDVQGFRDLSLKLTRLRQRVVIESNFEDDGEGNEKWNREQQRATDPGERGRDPLLMRTTCSSSPASPATASPALHACVLCSLIEHAERRVGFFSPQLEVASR